MYENKQAWIKINRLLRIAMFILLAWAIFATVAGLFFRSRYTSLQSVLKDAGGSELVQLIQQHGDTILSVYDDLFTTRGELKSALERAEYAEHLNNRAIELAERSDEGFDEFRAAMASAGGTITALIANQSRINEIIARIEGNNTAIKRELGSRPGTSD